MRSDEFRGVQHAAIISDSTNIPGRASTLLLPVESFNGTVAPAAVSYWNEILRVVRRNGTLMKRS
jgi:hypothetical protein